MSVMPYDRIEHASELLVQGLAADVELALWQDDRLRSTDTLLTVQADPAGMVTLTGSVRGDMLKDLAGRIARRVPGVSAVSNQLQADTDLENEVAMALALDPNVGVFTDQLIVKVVLGVVQLSGNVTGTDQAAAEAARAEAGRLAGGIPGVREVLNVAKAVVGSAGAGGEAPAEAEAGAGGDAHQAEMQARLAVWRERVAAKQAGG
jgi:osmotically-inducible protein OsmY